MEASNNKPAIVFYIMGLIVCSLIILNAYNTISDNPIGEGSDASYYIRMGYNVFHNNCFSGQESKALKPSAFREPLYALYLAGVIAVSPELKRLGIAELVEKSSSLQRLRHAQIPILLIISLVSAWLIYCITGKYLFSFFALILTGFSGSLIVSMDCLMAEHLAVMLSSLVAISFYKSIKTKNLLFFTGLGVSLALLVLTKAIFMYFIIFIIMFLLLMKKAGFLTRAQLVRGLAALMLSYAVLIGGWVLRNYIHFDNFYITNRSGTVLAIRAQYNKMNVPEYFGSFLYWAPGGFIRKILHKTYGDNALEPEGTLGKLNRANHEGYYFTGWSLIGVLSKGEKKSDYELHNTMQKISIEQFFAHPIKEVLVTIPILWRGIFYSHGLNIALSYNFIRCTGVFSLIYFLSFIILVILTIKNRRWDLFCLISIPLYLFALNALATHGLPRYNLPVLGIIKDSFLVVIFYFTNKRSFGRSVLQHEPAK